MNEGSVKYTAAHENTQIPQPPLWAELNEARTKCFNLGLVGAYPDGIGYGNLSMRIQGNEFLITGTGTGSKPILSMEDYCIVKSFDIARNSVASKGLIQASAESMTHGAVYRACSGVNCVIHIHSKKIFDNMLCKNYPFTPKEAEYGTPDMALAVEKCAGETGRSEGSIVLAGHDEGIITFASNIEKALSLVLELYKITFIGG